MLFGSFSGTDSTTDVLRLALNIAGSAGGFLVERDLLLIELELRPHP